MRAMHVCCCALVTIGDASVLVANKISMVSASLVDSVSQANSITFYGSVASVGQHLVRYLERTKG